MMFWARAANDHVFVHWSALNGQYGQYYTGYFLSQDVIPGTYFRRSQLYFSNSALMQYWAHGKDVCHKLFAIETSISDIGLP